MGNTLRIVVTLVFAVSISACATFGGKDGSGNSKRRFTAHSIIYSRAPEPTVTTKVFRTEILTLTRSSTRSFRFSNYVNKQKNPDVVVTLALSGARAGLAIYDGAGNPMMQFPSGKVIRDLVEFETENKEGSTKIRWFLAPKMILSIFEAYDANGVMGYSENTVYLLK
ncbi:MAG: hypothetical protein OEZ04_01020 [Nitrospinota bacterium]|nr:hypothetical protein [Nitrospinota bacterium]